MLQILCLEDHLNVVYEKPNLPNFKEAAISFLCADLSEAGGGIGVLFVMI